MAADRLRARVAGLVIIGLAERLVAETRERQLETADQAASRRLDAVRDAVDAARQDGAMERIMMAVAIEKDVYREWCWIKVAGIGEREQILDAGKARTEELLAAQREAQAADPRSVRLLG